MKVLIGTRNVAKIEMMKTALAGVSDLELISLNDIPEVDDSSLKEGNDYRENARKKSEFYFAKTGIPTLSTDHILWLEKWPKNNGVVVHIRAEAKPGGQANDEETMQFIENFVKEHGESKLGYIFAVAFTDEKGTHDFTADGDDYMLVGKRCETLRKGFPLDSYTINLRTGKYLSEQSDLESFTNYLTTVRKDLMPLICPNTILKK